MKQTKIREGSQGEPAAPWIEGRLPLEASQSKEGGSWLGKSGGREGIAQWGEVQARGQDGANRGSLRSHPVAFHPNWRLQRAGGVLARLAKGRC